MGIAGQVPLRLLVGGLMLGHGLQKATRRFGGNPEQTAAGFERMGLTPGKRHAQAAATAEIASGVSLLTGTLTPVGCAAISGTMTVAAGRVHGPKGLWINKGGCEYNLVMMGIAYAITALGPGRPSIGNHSRWQTANHRWAVLQLLCGVTAGFALLAANPRPVASTSPSASGGGA